MSTKPELKVVPLNPDRFDHDVVRGLRWLADQIESGEMPFKNVSVAFPNDIYHFGEINAEKATLNCAFNLQRGLYILNSSIETMDYDKT